MTRKKEPVNSLVSTVAPFLMSDYVEKDKAAWVRLSDMAFAWSRWCKSVKLSASHRSMPAYFTKTLHKVVGETRWYSGYRIIKGYRLNWQADDKMQERLIKRAEGGGMI